jgi:hypothetical protein
MNEPEMIDVYIPKSVRYWGRRKQTLEELKNDIQRLEEEGINLVCIEILDNDDGDVSIYVETYIRRPMTEKEIHDRQLREQNALIKKEEDERRLYQQLKLKYKDL